MTVLAVERLLVDASRRAAFDRSADALLGAMRDSDGFLWADAAASSTEPELVLILSEWRTGEALDRFCEAPAYEAFRDVTDVCLREDVSVRRFEGA